MDRSTSAIVADRSVEGIPEMAPTAVEAPTVPASPPLHSPTSVNARPQPSPAPKAPTTHWSPLTRIAFRFAFIYFAIYSFPGPLSYTPMRALGTWWDRMWFALVPWVGEHVVQLATPITVMPNGSGDTTFNYVQVLCFLMIALAGTAVWSIIGESRGRPAYPWLHELLRIYVRYTLALTMLSYGMAKVTVSQFPAPGVDRLLQPYGESSPMGILWTFMGASAAYTIFAGLAETIGGLLLFFRRTTLPGAMVVAAVMTNVVMLNFCYDVPVKLYSTHLLAMALFLLLPDARRLANVILLNRPAPPRSIGWPWPQRWLWWSRLVVKIGFVGVLVVAVRLANIVPSMQHDTGAPRQALEGAYDVEVFTRDGETIPPLLTDASRWRRVSVNRWGFMSIRPMTGEPRWYRATITPATGTVVLSTNGGGTVASLTYREVGADEIVVEGTIDGATITATLRRIDERSFLLMNRGFHWINEYPFNR